MALPTKDVRASIVVQEGGESSGGKVSLACGSDERGKGEQQATRIQDHGGEDIWLVVIEIGDGGTQLHARQRLATGIHDLQGIEPQHIHFSDKVSMHFGETEGRGAVEGRAVVAESVREIKRTRLNLDFQALVTAHQVERLSASSPGQEGFREHLRDRLHRYRFGTGRPRGGACQLFMGEQWCLGDVVWHDKGSMVDLVLSPLLEKLLQGEAAGSDMRAGRPGGKGRGGAGSPVAQKSGQEQETE